MKILSLSFLIPLCALFSEISQGKDLELVLRLQEKISMEELAAKVTDINSNRYGQFYTPEEIRAVAGPTDSSYSQTLDLLKSKGFKILREDKTHLFVTVIAPQATVEEVFSTRLEFVDQTKKLHRPLLTAHIPEELSVIQSVIGLDNLRKSRHAHKIVNPLDGQWLGDPNAGIQPAAIKELYGFSSIYSAGHTGVGQHIAIATYDNFHPLDVQMYWANEDIKPEPQLDEVYFNGVPNVNDDSCSETELDSEFSGMIAPGAKIHVFPSAQNNDLGEVQLFTAILDDNRAKVVNYSWGDCEANLTAKHANDMNQVFARAVAQGVNIMAASGDWGSYGCADNSESGKPGKVNADWPAANPYVVAVGGTSIMGKTSGGVNEDAWDNTGGGVSTFFPQPSWQKGFQAPFLNRSFPDVAFNADPYTGQSALVHYKNQLTWLQFGGTSISAPQWSGFLALVNGARGNRGSIGYLNPIIYGLSPEARALGFNDVTKGSNGAYKAGPGWDATTGWGSMKAKALFDVLTK